ncbi:MAG: N-6 DNA methylase [Actinomycetes bacterium]
MLVRSKERVAAHGEVFTPPELVEAMLDLVQSESERIDSRFLEPACGSGNFLVPVLARKLTVVEARYGGSDFERVHHALLALMSIYGIELLEDNVRECRDNLLGVFIGALRDLATDDWRAAGTAVLRLNIVHGDALSMTTQEAPPGAMTFAEWSYVGKGIYRRRDFRFDTLTQMSSFGEEGSLFAELGRHEIFTPDREFPPLSVHDIAELGGRDD